MMNWLKHAFAIEQTEPAAPTPSQADFINRVCREVVRRQLTLPAQMLLETSVPMHYLAGQMLRFLEPVLATVLNPAEIRDFATFVEHRGSVEYICHRLDQLQSDRDQNKR